MFWWRTMARRWSAILVCPWNWQEIASYGLVKRKTLPSVRSAHKHSLNWNIITTWSCWNLGHVGSYLRIRCPELPIQTHHKSTFPPHTCIVLLSRWAQSATWPRKCWRERWTSGTVSRLWNRWTCMPSASSTGKPSWDALTFFQVRNATAQTTASM